MKHTLRSLICGLLLAPAFASAASTLTYPVEIPFSRLLKCMDFDTGLIAELAWPRTDDVGPAAEAVRYIRNDWQQNVLSKATFFRGTCAELSRLKGTLHGYVSIGSVFIRAYPVSRGEEDEPVEITYNTFVLRLGTGHVDPPNDSYNLQSPNVSFLNATTLEWTSSWGEGQDVASLEKYFEQRIERQRQSKTLVPKFRVGDVVTARADSDSYYPATVTAVSPQGMANVSFHTVSAPSLVAVPLVELGYRVKTWNRFHEGQRIQRPATEYEKKYEDAGEFKYAVIRELYSDGHAALDNDNIWVKQLKGSGFEPAP